MPDWAHDMVDLHVHSSPSLLPRHGNDRGAVETLNELGFSTLVLKAHEGSTVERAASAGHGVVGGVVLNSAVGGANPDAVQVAARLGGRMVWMPTVSSSTHKAAAARPELSVHRGFELSLVEVFDDGRLRPEWFDVLDVVAEHDLVLASGHLAADDSVILFEAAAARGVSRMLVNHPKMAFLEWNEEAAGRLRALGAHLELGILPDLLGEPGAGSINLVDGYPHELLVFGGDLGHAHHPSPPEAVPAWLRELEQRAGERSARAIMCDNGRKLLLP